MRRPAAAYAAQLRALLPPGRLWDRWREEGSVADRLLRALAEEPARVDARAWDLLDEADPRTAWELLADWEQWAGLPDPCLGPVEGTDRRRAALVARLTARGGQSRAYYEDLAATLGYSVIITEYRPHTVDADVTDPLRDEAWAYAWEVAAGSRPVTPLTVAGGVGDPLAAWGDELLECAVRRWAPAHTTVIFSYS
ncbi:DUF2313 domain-containing protein [Dissulfurirhabdus thermomarina]|uniref:DUF2313 domain-containing protein n=1 Tax=Dissulfurirhabdus thermomarina TaxID=1765737 RepID=A0A6N9TJ05_DISTH|nr:putative phage tail protein [Dissulfurirhabdus thermomarina]NDY41241.1 DUF2313 domain-containing protein [Dissulfurirhabdus thermomarina]